MSDERKCRYCGCTEDHACVDPYTKLPCRWVEPDLCSECVDKVPAEPADAPPALCHNWCVRCDQEIPAEQFIHPEGAPEGQVGHVNAEQLTCGPIIAAPTLEEARAIFLRESGSLPAPPEVLVDTWAHTILMKVANVFLKMLEAEKAEGSLAMINEIERALALATRVRPMYPEQPEDVVDLPMLQAKDLNMAHITLSAALLDATVTSAILMTQGDVDCTFTEQFLRKQSIHLVAEVRGVYNAPWPNKEARFRGIIDYVRDSIRMSAKEMVSRAVATPNRQITDIGGNPLRTDP